MKIKFSGGKDFREEEILGKSQKNRKFLEFLAEN